MRWHRVAVVPGVIALVALAGCGGGANKTAATTAAPATTVRTTASEPSFRITIEAPTHRPKANVGWPVTIRVTDSSGKPLAAKLKMRLLFGGTPVGEVDNGRVYRFVGTWRERPGNEITFPVAAVGQPLTFQAVVTAQGKTRTAGFWIRVRK